MFVLYGKDLFGYIERVPGQFSIATEFLHFWYIPTIPLGSYEVLEHLPASEPRNRRIPLDRRSVIAAWMRSGALAVAIVALIAGALLTWNATQVPPGRRPPLVQWVGPLALSLVAYIVHRRSLRRELATPESARSFAGRLGMSPELVDLVVLPALAGSGHPPASGWLRMALMLAGLAMLTAGGLARKGDYVPGQRFARVGLADIPAAAASYDKGHIEIEASFDTVKTLHDTGLEVPLLSPYPADRVTTLDAATLSDDARLTALLGAPVEVRSAAEGPPLRFEYEALPDTSKNLRLFPLAGTGRRVWVASRWFSWPPEETLVTSFTAGDRFTGRLSKLSDFHENVIRAPDPDDIADEARRQGQEPPPEGAFLVQTGGRYQDTPTSTLREIHWAYVPVTGAPEPTLVEVAPENLANLASPVKGHVSRNSRVGRFLRERGVAGIPTEGALVLDAHWALVLLDQIEFRTRVLLGLGAALTLLGAAWRLLP